MNERRNEILELSFLFALKIIDFIEILEQQRKYVLAKQLLRSGTSIGANIRVSQSAESKADFIHKLKIAHKETLETDYWLSLSKLSTHYPDPSEELESISLSIKKILNKIISSSKKNMTVR